MIALGIDPGSRRCGYGVVAREGTRLVVLASGVLVPGADRPVAERLARILDGLVEVIRHVGPAECSIEQVFCGASPRPPSCWARPAASRWAAAAQAGLPVFEYAPSEVKLAFTGSGRATKDQMLRTARLCSAPRPAYPTRPTRSPSPSATSPAAPAGSPSRLCGTSPSQSLPPAGARAPGPARAGPRSRRAGRGAAAPGAPRSQGLA